MAPGVMRPSFGLAGPHRHQQLRAVQGLNLRSLVDTEDAGGFIYNPTMSRTLSISSGRARV